jgi:cytochrome P450
MLETPEPVDVAKLPLAPKNPLPMRQQLRALRDYIDGVQQLLDAGGPVTRFVLGPKWLLPTAVLIASPQGARDVLGRSDEIADRGGTRATIQMHRLMGGNLLVLPHEQWLPRRRTLQPMFTKQRVARYAGHMAAASQTVVDGWGDGATVDLDTECRALTLRALGRSVLGLDLDARADTVGPALRTALSWVADRAGRPVTAAMGAHPASGGPAGPMRLCISWPPRSSPRCAPTPTETHHWYVH